MNNDKRNQLPWRITGGIIGLILLLSLISFLLPETIPEKLEKKIANVEVQTLETVRFDEMLELPARIQADRIGIVSSELPGKLAKWVVAEGETVSSGDVVAELDKSSLISKTPLPTPPIAFIPSGIHFESASNSLSALFQ